MDKIVLLLISAFISNLLIVHIFVYVDAIGPMRGSMKSGSDYMKGDFMKESQHEVIGKIDKRPTYEAKFEHELSSSIDVFTVTIKNDLLATLGITPVKFVYGLFLI
jgi:hypothetical protein